MKGKLNDAELKAKIDRMLKLKDLIESKVKAIYEEHSNLTGEIVEEVCLRNSDKNGDGFLKEIINFKLKGDTNTYSIVPNYMKNGQMRNVIWKSLGVQAFTVIKQPL